MTSLSWWVPSLRLLSNCSSAVLDFDPQKRRSWKLPVFFPTVSQSQSCQVDYIQDHDQGSGEHGAVSSLPAGLGQASGRVDVPDGTKIEAAAQSPGTSCFRSWNADALCEVQARCTNIQFFLRVLMGTHGLCGVWV